MQLNENINKINIVTVNLTNIYYLMTLKTSETDQYCVNFKKNEYKINEEVKFNLIMKYINKETKDNS